MKVATLLAFAMAAAPLPGSANVITDWDDITIRAIQPLGPVPPIGADVAFRASAMVNVSMFNAVNNIEPKYAEYKIPISRPVLQRPHLLAPANRTTASESQVIQSIQDIFGWTLRENTKCLMGSGYSVQLLAGFAS